MQSDFPTLFSKGCAGEGVCVLTHFSSSVLGCQPCHPQCVLLKMSWSSRKTLRGISRWNGLESRSLLTPSQLLKKKQTAWKIPTFWSRAFRKSPFGRAHRPLSQKCTQVTACSCLWEWRHGDHSQAVPCPLGLTEMQQEDKVSIGVSFGFYNFLISHNTFHILLLQYRLFKTSFDIV